MKISSHPFLLLVFLLIVINGCNKIIQGERVNINDVHFLEVLISQGVDRNGDGIISEREAELINKIEIWPSDITDLTGIEAFRNLDTLAIIMNPLESFDISQNKNLKYLECIGCKLNNLDVSNNLDLEYLDCSGKLTMQNFLDELNVRNNTELKFLSFKENSIEEIDLSANLKLETIDCGYNELTELDISANRVLIALMCNNNLLTHLDLSENRSLNTMISCGNKFSTLNISRNTELKKIGIDNMPGLTEVCVWTLPFPPSDVTILMGFSPNVRFITACDPD